MDLALACGCNSVGSISIECDADGICNCKTDVIGDKCTSCKPGYSEFPSCSKPFYKSKYQFIIFSIKLLSMVIANQAWKCTFWVDAGHKSPYFNPLHPFPELRLSTPP